MFTLFQEVPKPCPRPPEKILGTFLAGICHVTQTSLGNNVVGLRVFIFYFQDFLIGGGCIYTPKIVLTVAHVVEGWKTWEIRVCIPIRIRNPRLKHAPFPLFLRI